MLIQADKNLLRAVLKESPTSLIGLIVASNEFSQLRTLNRLLSQQQMALPDQPQPTKYRWNIWPLSHRFESLHIHKFSLRRQIILMC